MNGSDYGRGIRKLHAAGTNPQLGAPAGTTKHRFASPLTVVNPTPATVVDLGEFRASRDRRRTPRTTGGAA